MEMCPGQVIVGAVDQVGSLRPMSAWRRCEGIDVNAGAGDQSVQAYVVDTSTLVRMQALWTE